MQRLSLAVIAFFQSFQGENPYAVLIADTTILERPRAKKVELCSRVYDYVKKVHTKGFRTLAVGYSDGHNFLPLGFALFCAREARTCRRAKNKSYAFTDCAGILRCFFEQLNNILDLAKAYRRVTLTAL